MSQNVVKVVETSTVTAEEIERILNEAIAEDWILDGIHFAMRESSRRPSMAFLIFYRESYSKKLSLIK